MIYFDNAATTWPKPSSVINAMNECVNEFGANPGRSGHSMAIKSAEKVYECRETLASFFGLENPGNVIFTSNATHGLNIVINGVLDKGDHVICTVMDHNSVLRPIYAKRSEIEFSFLEANTQGEIDSDELRAMIKDNTKLVVMTHVSNVCGTVMPIDKVLSVCKEKGILFMLDASQSAGIVPVNLKNSGIDYLACPGHKGLYGPMGTGVLCINSEVIPKPLMYGGTGSLSKNLNMPDELPERLESGTLNLPGICGLCQGVKFIESIGLEQVIKHEKNLTSVFLEGLSEIKNYKIIGKSSLDGRCGVVSFVHDYIECVKIAEYLNSEFNIAVRSMYHCAYLAHKALGTSEKGSVRVSWSVFNTVPEIKMLLYALSHI